MVNAAQQWELARRAGRQVQNINEENRQNIVQLVFTWLANNPTIRQQIINGGTQALNDLGNAARDALQNLNQQTLESYLLPSQETMNERARIAGQDVRNNLLRQETNHALQQAEQGRGNQNLAIAPGWNVLSNDENNIQQLYEQSGYPDENSITNALTGTSFPNLPWKQQPTLTSNKKQHKTKQRQRHVSHQQVQVSQQMEYQKKHQSLFHQQSHMDYKKHIQQSFQPSSG